MTELVPHKTRSSGLAELARSHVADGSISEPETPALLRRVARERFGAEIELRVVVEAASPVFTPPKGHFALVGYEVRPGVRNYRLARVPKNDPWRIRFGAFERAIHLAFRMLARRLKGALRRPKPIAAGPEPAFHPLGNREGRVALLSGPSGVRS